MKSVGKTGVAKHVVPAGGRECAINCGTNQQTLRRQNEAYEGTSREYIDGPIFSNQYASFYQNLVEINGRSASAAAGRLKL